jgi:hypothetical protein
MLYQQPNNQQKKLPAAAWKGMLKMLSWYETYVERGQGTRPQKQPAPTDTILIRNDSGADRDRYDCLKVGSHELTTPDQYQRMLAGVAVASPADAVAILQEPIPHSATSARWGLAQVSGCCWAYVDIDATSGLDHNRAIPAAASYQLASAFAGPHRILWQPGSTGKQLCLVHLWAPCHPLYALTGASGIAAATIAGSDDSTTITPASATCSLFYWDEANSRWAILTRDGSAVEVTIYNNWDETIGQDAIIKVSCADDGKLTVDSELCGEA